MSSLYYRAIVTLGAAYFYSVDAGTCGVYDSHMGANFDFTQLTR